MVLSILLIWKNTLKKVPLLKNLVFNGKQKYTQKVQPLFYSSSIYLIVLFVH